MLSSRLNRDLKMAHRFKVGQLVEYKPIGAKVGLFTILRHLPEELSATDWKYRIKNDGEGFERTVLECDLSPSIVPEASYDEVKPLRRAGRHH
jgi:hypothetical protein